MMNLRELGALLKAERERRGLSVRDVMDSTKISRRNLTALEEGNVRALPHPVYLKGYVRNYAKLVGLRADQLAGVVDQQDDGDGGYLPQAPASDAPLAPPAAPPAPAAPLAPAVEPQETAPEPPPAPALENEPLAYTPPEPLVQPKKAKSGGTLRSVLVLLLLLGVLGGLLVHYQRLQREAAEAPAPVVQAAQPVVDAAASAAALDNATALDNTTALDNAAVLDNATGLLDNATLGVLAPAAFLPPQTEPFPVLAPKAPEAARPPVEQAKPAVQAKAAEARTPGMQVLTITAKSREICWVGVYEGEKATTFTLRDGESRQVEFAKRARLRLGNAGGVTVRLNGQDYPFEGDRGQKVTVEFGAR